jgi:hypothetical protein
MAACNAIPQGGVYLGCYPTAADSLRIYPDPPYGSLVFALDTMSLWIYIDKQWINTTKE